MTSSSINAGLTCSGLVNTMSSVTFLFFLAKMLSAFSPPATHVRITTNKVTITSFFFEIFFDIITFSLLFQCLFRKSFGKELPMIKGFFYPWPTISTLGDGKRTEGRQKGKKYP